MDSQGDRISALENRKVLERARPLLLPSAFYHLPSDPRSFGAWLEPRYIFGAGQLFDQ
jgi:hypothetical protein